MIIIIDSDSTGQGYRSLAVPSTKYTEIFIFGQFLLVFKCGIPCRSCGAVGRSQVIDFQCPGRRWGTWLAFSLPLLPHDSLPSIHPYTQQTKESRPLHSLASHWKKKPSSSPLARLSLPLSMFFSLTQVTSHLLLTQAFIDFFPPLQLLLEYDDLSWDQREWTSIHQTGVFHVFLVEHDLWWAEAQQQLCPALVRWWWWWWLPLCEKITFEWRHLFLFFSRLSAVWWIGVVSCFNCRRLVPPVTRKRTDQRIHRVPLPGQQQLVVLVTVVRNARVKIAKKPIVRQQTKSWWI